LSLKTNDEYKIWEIKTATTLPALSIKLRRRGFTVV